MRIFPLVALVLGCASPAPVPTPPASAPAPASIAEMQPTFGFPAAWAHRGNRGAAFGQHAMVASDAALASRAGVEVLRAGGNAVDAAVAVGFALAVVYPEAGNLGGGGFAVIRMADGRTAAIDYREVAPLSASRNMFVDTAGNRIASSVQGPLASGVPGSVAGLMETHQRFGVLPRAAVIAPAIRLAEGFVVDSQLNATIASNARIIAEYAGSVGTSMFLPGGQPIAVGATLRQPALARTLRAIADSGAAAFYTGSVARTFVEDFSAVGGNITAADLAGYSARWREPLRSTYRGRVVLTMPPPSSGAAMVQILNILEGFDSIPAFGSATHVHRVASAMQRAFIDRNARIGDPAFHPVPVDQLTSKSYAAKLRAGIGNRARPTPDVMSAMSDGAHTTHYSVVDAAGNAVSTTTTINDLYGSGVYLPNVGIFLNDEMDDFAAAPGQPNLFGLIQGEQNAIVPGKRMLSSMLPTIVLDRAGRPELVLGARGGPRIITSVTQTILNVIDYDMNIVDAINAPRLHHQALPDTVRWESEGFGRATLDSLAALGYGLRVYGSGPAFSPRGNIGSVNGIQRVRNGWVGYSDPRTGGRPAGY